jgi:hypothetical protein
MLTVVCKATFVLRPGESTLAPDQDPPNEADTYWNDDEPRSLHMASDLVPFKRHADVFLVGHAYSPHGQPVSSLVARLAVGDVDKAIEVHADRAWTPDGKLHEGVPFTKMALHYERAAGGPETSNPVGVRVDAPPDMYGMVSIPNLQPPGFCVTRPGEAISPIGFGPIAAMWPARLAKLYQHAAAWDHRHWRRRPLPEDIDAAFFNVAPPDQQVSEIQANERIVLENLHPEHARLVTSLPGVAPRAMVEGLGMANRAMVLRCDTLCIDTDRGVCNLVWRGQVALARADELGRVVISTDSAKWSGETVGIIEGRQTAPVLPFRSKPTSADGEARDEDTERVTTSFPRGTIRPALPFREELRPPEPEPEFVAPQTVAIPKGPPSEPGEPVRLPCSDEQAAAIPTGTRLEDAPEAPAPLPVDAYPLERCARIAASIARRSSDKDEILKAHALDVAMWSRLDEHWARTLRSEAERQKDAQLKAYDTAYVAQLEEERSPITVDEYARIAVASERGNTDGVMRALSLPPEAIMRVRRVWIAKIARDVDLAARVRRAVQVERDR